MNGSPAMDYTGPTFRFPPTMSELLYPAEVFGHLPRGSPRMYRVEEVIHNGVVVPILAHFTNSIDAFYLLGRVFWCGCEFIAFTIHNIFTDYTNIFPTAGRMHTLSYPIDNTPEEQ
ncbi:hypothetical protein D1007_15807 [Hordeum vulgare]|nr:hypothetical protein D1007_15807 [Hordeum vulgare]